MNGVAVDLAQSGAVAEKMQSIYEIGRRAVHRGAIQAGAGIEGPEQRLPIRNRVVCREVRLPLGIRASAALAAWSDSSPQRFSPNKASAIALTCNARSYTSLARSAKNILMLVGKDLASDPGDLLRGSDALADRASVINSESKQAEEGIACMGKVA